MLRSTDCVAEAMKQTNSYVQETLESYLEGLEQRVAEVSYSLTCVFCMKFKVFAAIILLSLCHIRT